MARRPTGLTLIELVVVLSLAGLLFALTLPAFRTPDRAPDDAGDPVTRARRLALRRGQPVELVIHASGEWQVTTRESEAPLAKGRGAPAGRDVRLVALPNGSCIPSSPGFFDPVRCSALPEGSP